MNWLLTLLFPCQHRRLSFPITPTRNGKPVGPCYVCCTSCGREFHYDWEQMSVGRELANSAPTTDALPERLAGA
jgi:hypothetical protein